MQGIGKRGIDLGAQADQSRGIGSVQLKYPDKAGCRHQQAGPVMHLRTGNGALQLPSRRVIQRFEQIPDLGVTGGLRIFAKQRRS